jgi:HEAT repeat protein
MEDRIEKLVLQLSGTLEDSAYEASDSLGHIGSDEVVQAMIGLLEHPNADSRHLAARTLGLVANNDSALAPLLEAIQKKEHAAQAGDLLTALEGFDVSNHYVPIFKLYLFGGFKTSMIAKELMDYKEFDITPRVLKKAQKHWNHYSNNVKQDELFELRKIEVEEILDSLKEYIDE